MRKTKLPILKTFLHRLISKKSLESEDKIQIKYSLVRNLRTCIMVWEYYFYQEIVELSLYYSQNLLRT